MFLRYEVEMHENGICIIQIKNKEQIFRNGMKNGDEMIWVIGQLTKSILKFYLEKLDDFNIPSIKEQKNNSPDDYVPCQTSSIYESDLKQ